MPYLSALEVCLRQGAIQIHIYLYLYLVMMVMIYGTPGSAVDCVEMSSNKTIFQSKSDYLQTPYTDFPFCFCDLDRDLMTFIMHLFTTKVDNIKRKYELEVKSPKMYLHTSHGFHEFEHYRQTQRDVNKCIITQHSWLVIVSRTVFFRVNMTIIAIVCVAYLMNTEQCIVTVDPRTKPTDM